MMFVFYLIGFAAALFISWRIAKEEVYPERFFFDSLFFIFFSSLIGARFMYVFTHFEEFGLSIVKWILFIGYPGLYASGALIGGGIALWVLSERKNPIPFLDLIDITTKGILGFIAFSSIGSVLFESSERNISIYRFGIFILVFLSLFIYKTIGFRRGKKLGAGSFSMIFWFVFLTALFILEFFKSNREIFIIFTENQWVFLFFITICLLALFDRIIHKTIWK